MKKFILHLTALGILLALFGISVAAVDYPNAPKDFYAADFANLLNEETEENIINNGVALEKATGAQIVVVTVKSTGGLSANTYATQLGNKWGVGSKDKDNGAVILLVLDSREIEIATGKGMGGALPASLCGRIIDEYGIEHLRNNDYDTGLYQIFLQTLTEVYDYYGLEVPSEVEDAKQDKRNDNWDYIVTIVVFLIFSALVINYYRKRRKSHNDDDDFGGFGGGPIFRGGFYGGGFRGGSGGFGGGSFGGGGGRFGGGGAGRKF